jgi:dTDP-4-amino-4,6-dideoxygalactose transaminase
MTRTPNIIGGMFGLDAPFAAGSTAGAPFIEPGSLLLANARSGIHIIVEQIRPARVWMPSYLCGAMLEGVRTAPVQFYPVDRNLSIMNLDGVEERDLVVVIDYFGFPAPARLMNQARSRGAWVLEDACQALLTRGVGQNSDFVLFSPRKFLGVPDGGVLTSHTGSELDSIHLEEAPSDWALKALEAVLLRREFDLYGGDRRWFTLFQQIEHECPVGYFQMSGLAKILLLHAFDYAAIARRRRDNYARLTERLAGIALFPDLPPEVVPLGFPVRLPARDRVREALFAAQIYPPIHWPIADIVPVQFTESHQLNRDIMTLPCDQRYMPSDMDRIADAVLQANIAADK